MSVVVLLHGWGMSSRVWSKVEPALAQHSQVINQVLPGYAADQTVTDYKLESVVTQLVNDLKVRLASQGASSCVLVGWSMGGVLALQLALQVPSLVQGLCLLGVTPKFVEDENEAWPGLAKSACEQLQDALQRDPNKALQRFAALQCRAERLDKHAYQAAASCTASVQHTSLPTLQASLQCLMATDLRAQLMRVTQPMQWVFAKNDALVPIEVADTVSTLPQSQAVRVSTHHWGLLEPKLVIDCLEEIHRYAT